MNATAIPSAVRERIDARLDAIEQMHAVRILFAVESGSRAWGFPSPDSDFDVRFVYAHRLDWYLAIDQRRDVIELPIEDDLDISGWDLRKALQLLIKPNPVMLEWLRSPVVYRADQAAMDKIAALGERTAHQRPSTHHYLHLAESQYRRFIDGKSSVPLKKYFYCLRPALALLWLRTHPTAPVPMSLNALREGVTISPETGAFVDDLLRRKAKSKELGKGPRAPALDRMIIHEIETARADLDRLAPTDGSLLDEANSLFREIVAPQDRPPVLGD